jgi:hypothetical protein
MDDVFSDSCHFAAHFFSGSQMQLDSFAGAALKEAEDGGVWLQGSFFLSEQTGTGNRRNDDSDNK